MAEPILELESVVMDYGQTRVLHDLDLRIEPGEFTAITGPSGSGKSTLLNLMGLLERPTSGRLRVLGQDTARLSERALARLRGRTIGFVFQFHHLLQAFSARENVYMPVLVDRGRVDREMGQRADALLARVGLGERGPSPVRTLSGGQQQRVAIARALALEPPLVLADEPTGNLDTETADKVFDLLREVSADAGTAFIVVTHDPRLADRCDRIVRLVDGRIVSDATGEAQGPCRACGYGPCLREQCLRAEDIPGRVCP